MVTPSVWVSNFLGDNCTINICTSNICPSLNIMKYITWYQLSQILKVGWMGCLYWGHLTRQHLSKVILDQTWTHIFLDPKFFFYPNWIHIQLNSNFLFTKQFLRPKLFWTQIFLDKEIVEDQSFFIKIYFNPTLFWDSKLLGPKMFCTQNFV